MSSSQLERILAQIDLFQSLSPAELNHVRLIAHWKVLPAGEMLFWEEDPGDALYIIHRGTIKVFRTDPGGRSRTLRLLGPGEVIGEMAIFDGARRSACAQALVDCKLLEIGKQDFTELLQRVPSLGVRLLKVLAQRLREANRQLECLSFLDARQRLLLNLKQLAVEHGRPSGEDWLEITVPLTHEELAQYNGSSRETVTRALKQLEQDGKVRQGDRAILVPKSILQELE